MDALTFGTPVLLRHLTFSEARKMPIKEFHLSNIMEGFEMNPEQFVDLCILLGCDYVDKIKGIVILMMNVKMALHVNQTIALNVDQTIVQFHLVLTLE